MHDTTITITRLLTDEQALNHSRIDTQAMPLPLAHGEALQPGRLSETFRLRSGGEKLFTSPRRAVQWGMPLPCVFVPAPSRRCLSRTLWSGRFSDLYADCRNLLTDLITEDEHYANDAVLYVKEFAS